MIAHARAQFDLGRRTKDGATVRQHLMAAAEAGATPPELEVPPLPVCVEGLWGVFLDLHNARDVGMAASPIKPSEVLAYQRLHGFRLTSWEVDCIAALDRVALESMRTE